MSDYLTVQEVAKRLRISDMSVYRLLAKGEIRYHEFGKAFRILEAEYEAYVKRSVRP